LKKEKRPTTMYIKNKRDSSIIKVYSSFQHSCKLKVLCFAIAYFSYIHRYLKGKKQKRMNKMFAIKEENRKPM